MKKLFYLSLFVLLVLGYSFTKSSNDNVTAGKCMTCHKEKSPGIYNQWFMSGHAKHNVTCLDCHEAKKGESDAFKHEGTYIATLVTPKDCSKCHQKEAEQTMKSHHASAGKILASLDAYLAHAVGGEPVAITGCENCHGGKVIIDPKSPNKLSMKSWTNSGVGRINPDGSLGSCTVCHTRHTFSKAQARQPEACGKCHLGPDHPQKEIYEESKHGNTYFTQKDVMNLKSDRWIVGHDYFVAPTCASCHMSANPTKGVTHDVGDRLSWTLRPKVSKKQEHWKEKRKNMQNACITCHSQTFIDSHYYQFDSLVNLYNEKFAKPSVKIMKIIADKKLLKNKGLFGNKIEWIFWEIWHHEGRRARHGAAMSGPDYTWWHGIYEVGQHFYFKFLPEARKFHDPDLDKYIDELLKTPMHKWINTSKGEIKSAIKSGEFQKIYGSMFNKSANK